jgi:hypothetical protein
MVNILLLYSSTMTRKQTPTLAVKPKSHAWKPKISARHHNIMLLTTNQCFQTFVPSMFSATGQHVTNDQIPVQPLSNNGIETHGPRNVQVSERTTLRQKTLIENNGLSRGPRGQWP